MWGLEARVVDFFIRMRFLRGCYPSIYRLLPGTAWPLKGLAEKSKYLTSSFLYMRTGLVRVEFVAFKHLPRLNPSHSF